MKVQEGILKRAIYAWGEEAQMDMAIEEMAELMHAIQKFKRGRGSFPDRLRDVQEEIADVLMTAQQMRFMFGSEAVDEMILKKTKRLVERLDKAEAE